MIKVREIALIILSGILLISCTKLIPGRPTDLKDVLERCRLVVLADSSTHGVAFIGDSIFGFQYEIVKAFADSLNVELIISDVNDLNMAISNIETGEVDLIASVLPVTTEYSDRIDFSEPLFSSVLMLVQSTNSDTLPRRIIKNQSELANDTIFVSKNSQYSMRLLNLADEIADTIHISEIEGITNDSIIGLVASGVCKYAVCPAYFAKYYIKKYPNLDFSMPLGFQQNYSWAVHVNSISLLNKLNEFLIDFVDSYEYRKIYRKYF